MKLEVYLHVRFSWAKGDMRIISGGLIEIVSSGKGGHASILELFETWICAEYYPSPDPVNNVGRNSEVK